MTTTKIDPTIKHLASEYIDNIALSLDEDVYGANGDLTEQQIKERLIENIHAETNYRYVESGFPAWAVVNLIQSVWEYCDRKYMALMAETASDKLAELPAPRPMTFAFAGNKAVRLAAGTKCPHCGRGLHATSVNVDRNHVQMICSACHGDVLVVEDAP